MQATSLLEERHDPTGRSDYLSKQHVQRYEFAAELVEPNWRVLDIACGVGYGSGLLHAKGCQLIGVDYDDATVAEAREAFPAIQFETGDALALPFADASFDAIVSFETIEHVTDGQAFLAEMQRVLIPGGLLIISTPNIHYTAHPAYHLKEYEPDEFFSLMAGNFADIKNYAQYFLTKDRLADSFTRSTPQGLKTIVEKIGLKQSLRRLLRGENKTEPAVVTNRQAGLSPYAVVPFLNDRNNLRIMVCVAKLQPGQN